MVTSISDVPPKPIPRKTTTTTTSTTKSTTVSTRKPPKSTTSRKPPRTTTTTTTRKPTTTTKKSTTTTTTTTTTTKKTTKPPKPTTTKRPVKTTTTKTPKTTTKKITTVSTKKPTTERTTKPTKVTKTTTTSTPKTTTTRKLVTTTTRKPTTTSRKPTTTTRKTTTKRTTTTRKPTTPKTITTKRTTMPPKTTTTKNRRTTTPRKNRRITTTTTTELTTADTTITTEPTTTDMNSTDYYTDSTENDTTTTDETTTPMTTTTELTTTTAFITTTTTTEIPTTIVITTTTEKGSRFSNSTGVVNNSDANYDETSDYHFGDLWLNGTNAIPGTGIPLTSGPIGYGFGIALNLDKAMAKTCLTLKDFLKTDAEQRCILNPRDCAEGLSLAIWVKLNLNPKDKRSKYIISTGDGGATPGVSVFMVGTWIKAVVSTGNHTWLSSVPTPKISSAWFNLALRWREDKGLSVYVNRERVGFVRYPEEVLISETSQPRSERAEVLLGCRRYPNGTFTDFAQAEFDEFTVWMRHLTDAETVYFMGSLGGKACDPEKNVLKCETDSKKLFDSVRYLNLNNPTVFNDSIDFLRNVSHSVSEAASDIYGGSSSGNPFTPATKRGMGAQEEELLENKVLQDLRNWAKIINNVGRKNPQTPEQNITVEELDLFFGLQDVVNDVFNPATASKWKKIQQDSSGSSKVVSVLQNWVLQRLRETTFTGEPIRVTKFTKTTGMQGLKMSQDTFMSVHDPYLWFPNYTGEWSALYHKWGKPRNRLRIPNTVFGKVKKKKQDAEVNVVSTIYDTYHTFAPLQNIITWQDTSVVFLDSRVISFHVHPDYVQEVLDNNPVLIIHDHIQKRSSIGRRLLATDEMMRTQPILKRYCVRWDDELRVSHKWKGGWTTEGCWMVNTTWELTFCKCQHLGTFSLIAVIEKPFIFPEHGTWLRALKWLFYVISALLLLIYILVVFIRPPLHEQFHGIRVNSAAAAFAALTCFTVAEFVQPRDGLYHIPCAVLSGFSQYFSLAIGAWLYMEAHALFSAIVTGIVAGRLTCYMLTAWGLPAVIVGACLGLYPNFGDDFRCLIGKTNGMKLAFSIPVILLGMCALVQVWMTSCNMETPAIKKDIIVRELSAQNRALCGICCLFILVWFLSIFSFVDMGFDASTSFEPLFVIFISCFGIFMVCLWSFGSNHFKASLLNRNSPEKCQNKFYSLTWRLPSVELLRTLDPPDDSSSSTDRSQKSTSSRMT